MHKLFKSKPIFLVLILLCVFQVNAQEEVQKFSLDEAVDYALQNRVEVMNAVADEEIARAQKREVFGSGLPQVNASVDVANYFELPTSLIPAQFFDPNAPEGSFAEVQFGTKYNATAGISASQLLFSGSYIVAVQNSSEFIELAEKNTIRTKTDIAIEVAKSYYSILINKERMELLDKNVESLEKVRNETEKMFEAGFVEKIDVDRLTVSYNNLIIERDNIGNMMEVAEASLKFQMGLNYKTNIELTDNLDKILVQNLGTSLEEFNYSDRIEYQMISKQLEISQKLLTLERVGYAPTLSLYASYTQQAQRNEFNFFDMSENWYPIGIVGMQLNLNIFDGLMRKNRIEQKRFEIQKAENQLRGLQNAIDMETESAQISLKNSLASLGGQQQNMELATNVLETITKKYSMGTASSLEVIEAENALKEAQTNYYNALFNAIVAKFEFEKATGQFYQDN